MDSPGRGGVVVRRSYLIDRFRVVFESGGGWQCVCADFVLSNACRHTREAAGMRAAQERIAERVAMGRSHFVPVKVHRRESLPPAEQLEVWEDEGGTAAPRAANP